MANDRGRALAGLIARSFRWLVPAGLMLFGGVGLYVGVTWFLEGRYFLVRANARHLRAAWEGYGPDAFAGESPIYLITAGLGLSVMVWAAALLRAALFGRPLDLVPVGRTVSIVLPGSATVSLAMLVSNWSSGIPVHNFLPTGADDFSYAMWCVVPIAVLAGTVILTIVVNGMRARRRIAAGRAEG